MKTSVRGLYEGIRTGYQVTLRCGGNGLDRMPTWVYLAEDLQNIDFLKGGEFVITTGLFTRSGGTLIDLVRAVASKGCSAVLVNVGRYLSVDDLTEEVVDFCDAHRLPLLTVPWEIHLVDVMRELSMALVKDRQRRDALDIALTAVLEQQPMSPEALHDLGRAGYRPEDEYRLALIRNLASPHEASAALRRRDPHGHLFAKDGLHVLVLPVRDATAPIADLVETLVPYGEVSVGVCDSGHVLDELGSAYREARFALAVAQVWQRRSLGFDELGVLQLLFSVPDQEILAGLCASYLGPLEAYDAEHATQLVRTLQVYLLADCSPTDASVRLSAHRNTVVYRVNRIKEILGVDLGRATIKFNLLLALYIREYLTLRQR